MALTFRVARYATLSRFVLRCETGDSLFVVQRRKLTHHRAYNDNRPRWLRALRLPPPTILNKAKKGSPMASPYSHSYDEATLPLLAQAFSDTWIMLSERDPHRDCQRDNQLKTDLAEELMALVDEGVTDPNALCRLAFESFPPHL